MNGTCLVVAAVLAGAGTAAVGQVRFEVVVPPPGQFLFSAGVSGDGTTIVGYQTVGTPTDTRHAMRWTATQGITLLGNLNNGDSSRSEATGCSADGQVVVGSSPPRTGGEEAFRWTPSTGMIGVGVYLSEQHRFVACSADGLTLAGSTDLPWAFRWTPATGAYPIGDLGGYSSAESVSADGWTIVGGVDFAPNRTEPFVWTPETWMVPLGLLPGGVNYGAAHAVSADGAVAVGDSESVHGTQAFRWTHGGGLRFLDSAPQRFAYSSANAVSGDGAVVVGRCQLVPNGPLIAFVWRETTGIVPVSDVLATTYGIELTGWQLTSATGVSTDGTLVVGNGRTPCGADGLWILRLGEALAYCPADWNQDHVLNSQDLFDFLAAFFESAGDFNYCDGTNSQDLFDFLTAFFAGCS